MMCRWSWLVGMGTWEVRRRWRAGTAWCLLLAYLQTPLRCALLAYPEVVVVSIGCTPVSYAENDLVVEITCVCPDRSDRCRRDWHQ